MTESQSRDLDQYFQDRLLQKYKEISLLGGKATVIHHFKHKTGGYSLRWYVPNGIPLSLEQHNNFHGAKRNEMEGMVYAIKGRSWKVDLINQSKRIVKLYQLNFSKVKDHIDGLEENYI